MVDWQSIRAACVRDARARGLTQDEAEDAAQEAVLRAIEAGADTPRAYARRCVSSSGVLRVVLPIGCGIEVDEVTSEAPTQEQSVLVQQLAFRAVVGGVTLSAAESSMGVGGAARVARLRMRRAMAMDGEAW